MRRVGAPRRLVVVAVLAVGLLAAVAGPAGAHGPVGTMGIEVVPGAAPLTAQVRILLEYANDREVAAGATVTATATGPEGATVGPVPLLDRGQGRYDAVLTVPTAGSWSVAVTAADPAATAEATVSVSATSSSTSGTIAGDLGRPDDTDDTGDERAAGARDADDGSTDGPSPVLLIAIAVVLVAVGAVTFTLVRRRVSPPGS